MPSINEYGVDCTGWEMLHPKCTPDHLGYIPSFINQDNPISAVDQINQNYSSGWYSFPGFTIDPLTNIIRYPGDPNMHPIARLYKPNSNETIYFYESAWVMVKSVEQDAQNNCEFTRYRIARID